MTTPVITEQDLEELATTSTSLTQEGRAVLLESGTRDINAAPGSGKTTLLAANCCWEASGLKRGKVSAY